MLDHNNYSDFNADENALYSYVKVISEVEYMERYLYSDVYKLLVGDDLDILQSDDYGFVRKTKLFYHSYIPIN